MGTLDTSAGDNPPRRNAAAAPSVGVSRHDGRSGPSSNAGQSPQGRTTPAYCRAERTRIRLRTLANGRPRLSVFRSAKHIYAQVIDDSAQKSLLCVSTLTKDVKGSIADAKKTDAAKSVGKALAAACKAKGIEKVVFDRNGFLYHGRIKALADAAREAGLSF